MRKSLPDIKEVILKLDEISFHDVPVNDLSFNFDLSSFSIGFSIFNESIQDYDSWTLAFQEVSNLETESLILNSSSDIEIYRFDYTFDKLFEGNLLLRLGFGQPSFNIKFKCVNVILTKRE